MKGETVINSDGAIAQHQHLLISPRRAIGRCRRNFTTLNSLAYRSAVVFAARICGNTSKNNAKTNIISVAKFCLCGEFPWASNNVNSASSVQQPHAGNRDEVALCRCILFGQQPVGCALIVGITRHPRRFLCSDPKHCDLTEDLYLAIGSCCRIRIAQATPYFICRLAGPSASLSRMPDPVRRNYSQYRQ